MLKEVKHRYNKQIPVNYQLYQEYFNRILVKQFKSKTILTEEIKKVEMKRVQEDQKPKVLIKQQIHEQYRDNKYQNTQDDTIMLLHKQVEKLNLTRVIQEHQQLKQEEERKEEEMREKEKEKSEVKILPIRSQFPEKDHEHKNKSLETQTQTKQFPVQTIPLHKSQTNSTNQNLSPKQQPNNKEILYKLQKHSSNKQFKQPPETHKTSSKPLNQPIVLIDQTRTEPPSRQDQTSSPFQMTKSVHSFPTKLPVKQQSVSSKSQIDDLKSKYQASEKMSIEMKRQNQKLREQMQSMKKKQDEMNQMMKMLMQMTKK